MYIQAGWEARTGALGDQGLLGPQERNEREMEGEVILRRWVLRSVGPLLTEGAATSKSLLAHGKTARQFRDPESYPKHMRVHPPPTNPHRAPP